MILIICVDTYFSLFIKEFLSPPLLTAEIIASTFFVIEVRKKYLAKLRKNLSCPH